MQLSQYKMSTPTKPWGELAENFHEQGVGPFLQAAVENILDQPIPEKERRGLLIDFFLWNEQNRCD